MRISTHQSDLNISGQEAQKNYGAPPRWPRWCYGRRLIWSGTDEWGSIEVVKSPLGAALHFGTSALQGRIYLDEPWIPVAEYAVTMAGLAAIPAPLSRSINSDVPSHPRVCVLGLGTGSLAWTYHHLLPNAELTALELRPAVIEAARTCFRLNELSQLHIISGNASETIQTLDERSQTLIAIDLFTAEGMAPIITQIDFWRSVGKVLHPSGALCINAWSGNSKSFKTLLNLLNQWICPRGTLIQVDHMGFGNVVIFATPRPITVNSIRKRVERVDALLTPQQHWNRAQRREADRIGLSIETISQRLTRSLIK